MDRTRPWMPDRVHIPRRLAALSTKVEIEFTPDHFNRGHFRVRFTVRKGENVHGLETVINDDAPVTVAQLVETAIMRMAHANVDVP